MKHHRQCEKSHGGDGKKNPPVFDQYSVLADNFFFQVFLSVHASDILVAVNRKQVEADGDEKPEGQRDVKVFTHTVRLVPSSFSTKK